MTAAAESRQLPWADNVDHQCFGCAPWNPRGVALSFVRSGDELATSLRLGHEFESYPGMVHGGIVALVCDETMGNLVVLDLGVAAVTTSLRMRYVGVVRVDRSYRVLARLTGTSRDVVTATADVTDADGNLVASAAAGYHPLAERIPPSITPG